jgi:hypothetical protein
VTTDEAKYECAMDIINLSLVQLGECFHAFVTRSTSTIVTCWHALGVQLTRLLLCQLGGLTPEMSEAAPEGAAEAKAEAEAEAEAEAVDSGTEAGGSAPEVLGLGFAALKSESGNTHTCSFVSSVGTCD